jgi:hypothetical protein
MSAMRLTSRQLIFFARGVMTSRRQLGPAWPEQPEIQVCFVLPVFIFLYQFRIGLFVLFGREAAVDISETEGAGLRSK